jgi:serine/threonine protein kinase
VRSDQQHRVRELFDRALDRDENVPVEIWLAEQGPDDSAVRDDVRSLLEHHVRAGQFLSDPLWVQVPQVLADDEPSPPGTIIGAYTVIRELGRGGMGRVYLAEDARLGRNVALKALAPHLVRDAAQRERVIREARAAAALSHPGICTVHALEVIDDELYIVSEFVDGVTLGEEIRSERRPTPDDVRRTAVDLASALASAHAHGIVHRDLKPDNVMRTRDGRLKVLDFGLARMPRAAVGAAPQDDGYLAGSRTSVPGWIAGTPAYMAPEQLNGQRADARADVFAFGVLLYEFACGRHPFEGPTPLATIARILESEARPIDEVVPRLPASLAGVVARCLQKDREARFASAAEIVSALATETPAVRFLRRLPWWRTHQGVVMGLYVLAAAASWQIKDWQESAVRVATFVVLGGAAMVGGVLRGHLLFTSWIAPAQLTTERQRTARARVGLDVLMGLLLAVEAALVAPTHALAAVFTLALGVGVGLAVTVLEPATTRAVFGVVE